MKTNYSDMTEEQLEQEFQSHYGFDPSSIINVISQNPQIGMALVQIPISIANSLMHKHNDLKWLSNPTTPGYYWVRYKNGSGIGINEYSSKDINTIITTGHMTSYEFAGPLEPPK